MARDLCWVSANMLGWSLSFLPIRVIDPLAVIHMPFQMTRTSGRFCPHLDSACDFLALWGVSKCRNCQPLGVLSMFTVSPQRIRAVYSSKFGDYGTRSRGKLICCEIGKNFALNCVFLLLYEKLECCWNWIGVIFFGCHIVTEKQFQPFSFCLSPTFL